MSKSRVRLLTSAGIRPFVLLLMLVCWFAKPLSAGDKPHALNVMHFLRPGLPAIADLDGDNIPDLASGVRTALTAQGYSYRVDLDLSTNPEAKTFNVVSQDSTGLNIEAVDIDGDHDLDLLVSGRLSPRPIGIWVNDGRGRFTRGDPAGYVLQTSQTMRRFQPADFSTTPVLHFGRRPQMALDRQPSSPGESRYFSGQIHFPPSNFSDISTGSARFRAPPNPNS